MRRPLRYTNGSSNINWISQDMSIFNRSKERVPIDIVDGVEYYPTWRHNMAVRQLNLEMKSDSKLHKHRFQTPQKADPAHLQVFEYTTVRKDIKEMKEEGTDFS